MLIFAVSPNAQPPSDLFRDRKLSQYRADSVGNLMIGGYSVDISNLHLSSPNISIDRSPPMRR